jgi:GTP cyclohydrolase II
MSNPSKELTLRVHDECNGSDVFGSDICSACHLFPHPCLWSSRPNCHSLSTAWITACKPYLIFAIEECVRCAQRGGVGVVVYFRKEGRALGEVTKSVDIPGASDSPLVSFHYC